MGKRGAPKGVSNKFTDAEIETSLAVLAGVSGNIAQATQVLHDRHGITINPSTLRVWRSERAERFEEIREEVRPTLEKRLVSNLLDIATIASDAERAALLLSHRRLLAGIEDDPARAAANLSRVVQSSTDKMLALQGRPTQIRESRGVGEILSGLVAMGILQPPEEPKAIDATAEDEGEDEAA